MRSDEVLAKKSRPFRRKDLKMLLHVQDFVKFYHVLQTGNRGALFRVNDTL